MKPTQQEIIELAREASMTVLPDETLWWAVHQDELERFATLLLERFGAGGGEPFGYFCDWGDHDGLQRIAMYYGEPGSATFDDWSEYPKVHKNLLLYTRPSPTDLRAEYLRGLEDAKKIASNYGPSRPIVTKTPSQRIVGRWEGEQAASAGIADAIEALKGKQ